MQLSSLLTRLPEDAIARLSLADPSADVYTVTFVTPRLNTLREDVLYFGDTTLIAGVELPDAPSIVLFGSGLNDLAEHVQEHANVVTLADDADPFECFNILQAFFLESQERSAVTQRMLAAHFSNSGLQYLIEEAAMALGNPIVVVDTTYRYVAHHLDGLEGANTTTGRVMVREIQNETLPDSIVHYIREEHIDSKIAQFGGVLERYNEILESNTLTGAVMVRGVCIAHVMMIEFSHPFTQTERECFSQLLSFVGQEMQKNEVWGPSSGEMSSYFLANLLNDRQASEAITLRRLKRLNFHPKPLLRVLCLHTSGQGFRQDQIEQLAGQLRPMLHHSLYTRYHGNLVILVSRDDEVDFEGTLPRALREIAELNDLAVGISNTFERITEVNQAYEQARTSIRLGQMAAAAFDERRLYRYSDYAYLQMIDQAQSRTNLLAQCHPALLRLMEHDERHGGELMETLYWYLQVSGVTKRAAAMLNLHKNTLLYRIGRIKAILGMDLTSGEDLFVLQLGFRVLMYLGLFVPRAATSREALRE